MRVAGVLTLLLVPLLSGCTMPLCIYEVRWHDPDLVDLLEPSWRDPTIDLDVDGLGAAFVGAGVEDVRVERDDFMVQAWSGGINVFTHPEPDWASIEEATRALLRAFDAGDRALADAVVARLQDAPAEPVRWDGDRDAVVFRATDPLRMDVRGFLDAHFEPVPVAYVLEADGFRVEVVPRQGTGYGMGAGRLSANGFGAATFSLHREPEDDNREEVLLEEARATLVSAGLPPPTDADVVYLGDSCGAPTALRGEGPRDWHDPS